MAKIHHKFDDKGAPIAKTAPPTGLSRSDDAPNSTTRGVKRDSERNPKPKNAPPASHKDGKVQKAHPAQKADGFYGKNKRQKVGGGGFQPANKLKEKTRVSGTEGPCANEIKAKPGLKTNSSNAGASNLDPLSPKPASKPKLSEGLQGKDQIHGTGNAEKFGRDKKPTAKSELKSNAGASNLDPLSPKPAPKPKLSEGLQGKDQIHGTDNAEKFGRDKKPTAKPELKSNTAASKSNPTGSNRSLNSSTKRKSHDADDVRRNKKPKATDWRTEIDPTRPPHIQALYDKYAKIDEDRRNAKPPTPAEVRAKETRGQLLLSRRNLPIWLHQAPIRHELRSKDIMLLVGETGSGKSTQVPQFLCNEPWMKPQKFQVDDKTVSVGGIIAITQPRKIAATTLAKRVTAEMGCVPNDESSKVGYSVRFDKFVPKGMKIKFVTEGMLLQELLADPDLKQYSAVVVDEVHERTLNVDLITGFLKQIVTGDKRGRHGVPLKVVIMSATAKMESISHFFEDGKGPGSRRSSNASQATGTSYSTWEGFSNDEDCTRPEDTKDGNKSDGKVSNDKSNGDKSTHGDDKKDDTTKHEDIKDDADSVIINERNSESSATLEETADKAIKSTPPQNSNVIVHKVKGREYPVKLFHVPRPIEDYIDGMLRAVHKIHTTRPYPGDILCFLPGQDEIETVQKLIENMAATLNYKEVPFLKVMPLYGKMKAEDQQEVFRPLKIKRTRKVVLSTNIAETSVTVPGVRYVVDSGKAKMTEFRHKLGLESLLVKPISQSSADQRTGRAGREAEGECYRLYTDLQYLDLPESDVPEILRTDVIHAVLAMKARGVQDPKTFPLMDPPDSNAVTKALNQLLILGAITKDNSITDIGHKMARFPLSPAYARVIIAAASEEYDCVFEAIDAIACLDADGDIFRMPSSEKQKEDTQSARDSLNRREGDILTMLNTMQRYLEMADRPKSERDTWCEQHQVDARMINQAILIRRQLRDICVQQKLVSRTALELKDDFEPITEEKSQALLKCFLRAFADKTAFLNPDKSYRTTMTRDVIAIHPSSVLYGKKCEAILFLERVYTSKHFAKKVNMVQLDWVMEALGGQGAS